jgi:hypothetical protein
VTSYDTFTVYSNEVEYDPTTQRLDFRGDVLMVENGVRTTASRALIEITSGLVRVLQRE